MTDTRFGPGFGGSFGGVDGVERLCPLTDTVFLAKNYLLVSQGCDFTLMLRGL